MRSTASSRSSSSRTMVASPRILAPLLLYGSLMSSYRSAEAIQSRDLLPDCEEKAHRGDCLRNTEFMLQQCPASCEKQRAVRKVQVQVVPEGGPSFFDLEAEDVAGHTVKFRQFEGYITILVNVPRTRGLTEQYYKELDHLHDVWPWSVEVIAFPYKRAKESAESAECPSHKEADLKDHRKIHVMKEVDVNGPKTHPALRYLKNLFAVEEDELDEDESTFFLVNPDGSSIEMHHKATPKHVKEYIRKHLAHDL